MRISPGDVAWGTKGLSGDKALRITFLTPTFHPQLGGSESYTRHLFSAFAERGHRVEVITASGPGLRAHEQVDGISVTRIGPSGTGYLSRLLRLRDMGRAARRLDEGPIDVVVAQYSALAPAAVVAHRMGVPLIALVHDLYGWSENLRWRGPVLGPLRYIANDRLLAWSRPTVVVAVSRATARAVERAVSAPVVVVRPGVEHVPSGDDPDSSSQQVLFVGRLVRSKGVADVVAAAGAVRDRVPAAGLVVVGDGSEARALPTWVHRVSRANDAELDARFRSSAMLVFPSLREGWGLVVCEAAARRLPYIAYDIPAVREQHDILKGGVLVPPSDLSGLADAMYELLCNVDLRRRLGRDGFENARRELSWRTAAATLERAVAAAVGAFSSTRRRP